MKGEPVTVTFDVVSGGNYNAIALGTVTLEQALEQAGAALSLPHMKVSDQPDYRMRAIQMCIKHRVHQISKIKQGVDLCRQYKLNTLALYASNYSASLYSSSRRSFDLSLRLSR